MSRLIFAVDDSRSTSGSRRYWGKVSQLYDEIKTKEHINILWESEAHLIDDNKMEEALRLKGYHRGGTSISGLAYLLIKKIDDLENYKLILVSDGQVSDQEVGITDKLLEGRSFAEVNIYLINTGKEINLSVSTPFVRKTKFSVEVDGIPLTEGASHEEINLASYQDPDEFLKDFLKIKRTFVAQNMGRINLHLKKEILDLQRRLTDRLRESLETKYRNIHDTILKNKPKDALEMILTLDRSEEVKIKEIDDKIKDLIKVSENGYGYAFDAYYETETETSRYSAYDNPPNIKEISSPLLLISMKTFPFTEKIIANLSRHPFNLLKYPDLVKTFVETFGQYTRLDGDFPDGTIGGFSFDQTEEACQISNYTLTKLLAKECFVKDIELWFLLIFYLVKNYCPHLTEVIPSFEEHLRYRFNQHHVKVDNMTLPFGLALWYSFIGTTLRYANDPYNYKEEHLQKLYFVADPGLEGLRILGYPCLEEVSLRVKIFRAIPIIHSLTHDQIRSQYQNHLIIKDRFVFLDGPLRKPPPDFPIKDIPIGIVSFIFTLGLDDFLPGKLSVPLRIMTNYSYSNENPSYDTLICPATMRPYSHDPKTGKKWRYCAEEKFGKDYLSGYNYYLRYVKEKRSFPDIPDLILFMAEKEEKKNYLYTLPSHVEIIAKEVVDNYNKVKGDLSIEEFLHRVKKSYHLSNRHRMEMA